MEVFEVILDILDNLIVDKAFNKKISLKQRLPYIFIYYIVTISLLFFCIFFRKICVQYVVYFVENSMGY